MPYKIDTLIVGPLEVNCYLVWDDQTGQGVIIDPGDQPEMIAKRLANKKIAPLAILLTHGHGDHLAGVAQLKEQFQIPVLCGRGDEEFLTDPAKNLSLWLEQPVTAPAPDRILEDEELVVYGKLTFRVLATPGHSPGGVCYLIEEAGKLICGDTLFQGSVGRTDFPGSSMDQLLDSIRRKILTLPNGVICYPGHGPSTTVGAERVNNPFLTGANFA
jgi:hydroxyacylglutathione hydrolase